MAEVPGPRDPSRRLRRVAAIALFLLTLTATTAAPAAQEASALRHPALQEVLAMLAANLGEEVILARVVRLEAVPPLSGQALADLKSRGASDRLLLALLAANRDVDGTEPVSPSVSPSSPAAARLRIVIAPSFAVTQYRVAIDGESVHTEGTVPEGRSEPGRILRQPHRIALDEPRVAWDGEVAPGTHAVQVGYAMVRVEVDPHDDWLEYSRQSYSASGVRLPDQADGDGWSLAAPALCEVAATQVCEVVATFGKRSPTAFGGLPHYSVSYDVSVTTVPNDATHD